MAANSSEMNVLVVAMEENQSSSISLLGMKAIRRKPSKPHDTTQNQLLGGIHFFGGRRRLTQLLLALLGLTLSVWYSVATLNQRRGRRSRLSVSGQKAILLTRERWITDAAQPFNQGNVASEARHLIMVACHSVTTSGHLEDADRDERDWYLLDYQKHRGLPYAIVAHIQAGIQEAAQDPQALLMFSGGQTRVATGPESEGSSYYRVADAMNLWQEAKSSVPSSSSSSTVRARTVTEEFSTDSYENLLFSICRFYEVTGSYPSKITVVSFAFKQRRFETMHAAALRWPLSRFHYVGVDPPAHTGFNLAEATLGEQENAVKPFEEDPYGCHSETLQAKRKGRNPFARTPPYELSCPDMKEILHFCGPELIDPSKVPWNFSEL